MFAVGRHTARLRYDFSSVSVRLKLHTEDKLGSIVSVVAYDSLPGHQRFPTFVWLAAIDPGNLHAAFTRQGAEFPTAGARTRILAPASASVQDNWFSEPQ